MEEHHLTNFFHEILEASVAELFRRLLCTRKVVRSSLAQASHYKYFNVNPKGALQKEIVAVWGGGQYWNSETLGRPMP